MLDNTRLRAELSHIHRALSNVAASPRGKTLAENIRHGLDTTTPAILWQSLFSDCLRVVYSALAADGVIGDDEIAATYEFVFSAAKHYAGVLPDYREFAAIDEDTARAFLERYATDGSPFGERATQHWPGLTLCRRANDLGETEPIERYERMMSWLIPAACTIGGVTENDPRWNSRVAELHGLRRTLASTAANLKKPAVDPRLAAFLRNSGVFTAVQAGYVVTEADPFDVEKLHREVRTTFERMVDRATSSSVEERLGSMLLVTGESGSGKTHLLRSFRRHVHEYGRGFVVYAQMHSAAENYAAYLLHHVVDSLSMPYAGPAGEQTGLYELASGLTRMVDEPLRVQIEQLIQGAWDLEDNVEEESLRSYVNRLADNLLKQPDLARLNPDLIRVLLFSLYPDQRITSRVYKYLRCEEMNDYDRKWIGDAVPRTDPDHPIKMICDLARLAFLTRKAGLVLMVDQAELSGRDLDSVQRAFQRAIDTLFRIVDTVPSAIAVVACLTDVYDQLRLGMQRSSLDRLETEPPRQSLHLNRSYSEIEAIVGRRLSWLFAQNDAAYRPEEPVYPIPESALRDLVNRRTRDILSWCHRYQASCVVAKKLLDPRELDDKADKASQPSPIVDDVQERLSRAWNDALHASGIEIPDEDSQILELLELAAKTAADEAGLSIRVPRKSGLLRVQLAGVKENADLAIAVTNKGYHRGAFGTQIETLKRVASPATPVAVRTIEFPRGPACEKAIGQLVKSGGRRAYVDTSTLRTLAAYRSFQPDVPADQLAEWRRREKPISSLPAIAELFDLERLTRAPAADIAGVTLRTPPNGVPIVEAKAEPKPEAAKPEQDKTAKTRKPRAPKAARPARTSIAPPNQPMRVGNASSFGAEPKSIEVESLLRHTGILGSPGVGKTTLALNLIEQALERDIAVVLVDRKGDLAGYAKEDWWERTTDPARAKTLAERIDVRLFTPGTRGGRPLALDIVPDLRNIPEAEAERMVKYSANALSTMMYLDDSPNDNACRSILTLAIGVLAERQKPAGLRDLIALIESQDDQLMGRTTRYEPKLFKRLVHNLETVELHDAELFDRAAEPLTAETLVGRAPDGKVPLAIISMRFLGDDERIQSWVAHLISCMHRHATRKANGELHTLFMIDEADLFMPAGSSKPPSKEPLQDLLRRSPASGLGVLLASHCPEDFDYRGREQINTWFLGRMEEKRSIEKLKPLFEDRAAVAGKLGVLDAGRFVMLQAGGSADLDRTPSLLRTEQLAEQDLMILAAKHRSTAAATR